MKSSDEWIFARALDNVLAPGAEWLEDAKSHAAQHLLHEGDVLLVVCVLAMRRLQQQKSAEHRDRQQNARLHRRRCGQGMRGARRREKGSRNRSA
jgi:hypothetical protein